MEVGVTFEGFKSSKIKIEIQSFNPNTNNENALFRLSFRVSNILNQICLKSNAICIPLNLV